MFNFKIRYIASKKNIITNALFCKPKGPLNIIDN
jgi:hypothetical protein